MAVLIFSSFIFGDLWTFAFTSYYILNSHEALI